MVDVRTGRNLVCRQCGPVYCDCGYVDFVRKHQALGIVRSLQNIAGAPVLDSAYVRHQAVGMVKADRWGLALEFFEAYQSYIRSGDHPRDAERFALYDWDM